MKKIFTLSCLVLGFAGTAGAQNASINFVTEVITSYGGYWKSGSGTNLNSIQPENSHNLLAFVANNVRYSTGVDDQLVASKESSLIKCRFQALPVAALSGAPTDNTKVGVGQLFDGVNRGPSSPPPSAPLASYLTDGPNGLNLGTGIANLPAGTLSFTVQQVQSGSINDGVPDILVTQIASPSSKPDTYGFYDAQDKLVGNAVDVLYDSNFPVVGNWLADFYEASHNPMTLGPSFINTVRPLRLWSADLSRFGITTTNYGQIATFRIKLTGDSDIAFVAYNSQSVTVLPVVLSSFSGGRLADGRVRLQWRTASEVNSAAFVVEASTDGHTFAAVGRVVAAGDKASATDYSYQHRPAAAGTVYYRLHQLDRDGSSAYSPVVAVQGQAATAVRVAPNPFGETLRVQLPAAAAGTIRLLSVAGQEVFQHTLTPNELQAGEYQLQQLGALPPGLYLLQSTFDGCISTQKIVKE